MSRTLISALVALVWLAILVISYRKLGDGGLPLPSLQLARAAFFALFVIFGIFATGVAYSQRKIIFVEQFEGVVEALGDNQGGSGGVSPVIAFSPNGRDRVTFVDQQYGRYNYPNSNASSQPRVNDVVHVTMGGNGQWLVIQSRNGAVIAISIMLAFSLLGLALAVSANHAIRNADENRHVGTS